MRSKIFNLTIPAEQSHVYHALDTVISFAGTYGANREKLSQIKLVLEEILINIIKYAYPEHPDGITVIYRTTKDQYLIIEIIDTGIPFNPLSVPDVDTEASLGERAIGGLGVFIVRKTADKVRYRRENGENILHLTMKLD